jgi:Right handed beta helix region
MTTKPPKLAAFPLVILFSTSPLLSQSDPHPPRLLESRLPLSLGRTVSVRAGSDLQKALDESIPGDTVEVEAGAVFVGPFTLPRKTGSGLVVVRTSASEEGLPPPGSRVGPRDAGAMPKLEAAEGPVMRAAPGASGYRFIGIEIRPQPGHSLVNLVELGSGNEETVEALPSDIVFDRCYLHGDPDRGARRGIAMNARNVAIVDSYFADFKRTDGESQAIAAWAGPGPFKIVNNYLEAAGENLLFGGADPSIRGLVPSDIEVRGNHLRKPPAWNPGGGSSWVVKNLLELKNARRVLIEGNLLENNWRGAQNGFGILFTVRNQSGGSPWAVVEDVSFVNNRVRRTEGGINILGRDRTWPSGSGQTRRVRIQNNLFEEVTGRLFQLLDGTADVVIDHNTAIHSDSIVMVEQGPHTGFVFRNNIAIDNDYGIVGSGSAAGNDSIAEFFPNAEVRRNVLVGGDSFRYPPDNFFPSSLTEVGFVDLPSGDYQLSALSPFREAATDGRDPGVDFGALMATQGGVASEPVDEEVSRLLQRPRLRAGSAGDP